MATTPEGLVKKAISKVLDGFAPNVAYDMPVPSAYGRRTLDYVGVCCGKSFYIEAKAPGKKPTPRQWHDIRRYERAGAKVFVINEATPEALSELNVWIISILLDNEALRDSKEQR